jgi:hypothetical protein
MEFLRVAITALASAALVAAALFGLISLLGRIRTR